MRNLIPLHLLLLTLLSSCSDSTPKAGESPASSTLPDAVWSATRLDESAHVASSRKDAAAGSTVVIAGRVKDFVDSRAVFTLIDASLPSCREREGDTCSTPWDYCCETPETITTNTITVELRDETGRPLRTSFRGFHGLDHLDGVTVKGQLERDERGNVTIALTSLSKP